MNLLLHFVFDSIVGGINWFYPFIDYDLFSLWFPLDTISGFGILFFTGRFFLKLYLLLPLFFFYDEICFRKGEGSEVDGFFLECSKPVHFSFDKSNFERIFAPKHVDL